MDRQLIHAGSAPSISHAAPAVAGRYHLIEEIGRGGTATVWRARDASSGRMVAVKALDRRSVHDPCSGRRLRDEAGTTAGLRHPCIIQVLDCGDSEIDGIVTPYIVMELVPGMSLQQHLGGERPTPGFAMRVGAAAASALAWAHAAGLAHRDVKPANIMVAPDCVRVIDFGIAARIGSTGGGEQQYEVVGTPAYLAPERLLGDVVGSACDLYALGLVMYRMLTGRSPWAAGTTTQIVAAHLYADPEPLPHVAGVPESVASLCRRCLSKKPDDRPSAAEAAAVLALGAEMSVRGDEPHAPYAPQLPPSRDATTGPHSPFGRTVVHGSRSIPALAGHLGRAQG